MHCTVVIRKGDGGGSEASSRHEELIRYGQPTTLLMPYVVDGNNLIGHTPELRVRDENSRRELVKRISAFHRHRGAKVVIIFDGEAGPLVPDGLILGGVRVSYSGRFSNADEKIKAMVRNSKNPKELIVVSSDNEIYNFARLHKAKVMKCHEFNRELMTALSDKSIEKKPEVQDLEEWYRYFGIKDTDE